MIVVSFVLYQAADKGVCCSVLRREGGVSLAASSLLKEEGVHCLIQWSAACSFLFSYLLPLAPT
jgi:hypothetical protein